jgi:hypothetical protein
MRPEHFGSRQQEHLEEKCIPSDTSQANPVDDFLRERAGGNEKLVTLASHSTCEQPCSLDDWRYKARLWLADLPKKEKQAYIRYQDTVMLYPSLFGLTEEKVHAIARETNRLGYKIYCQYNEIVNTGNIPGESSQSQR